MENRIVIVCKRDYLPRFWKIDYSKYPDKQINPEAIVKCFKKLSRFNDEFKIVSPNGYYEVWNENKYENPYNEDMRNIEGALWPKSLKDFTFFPMANIKTEQDLRNYNVWRVTTFKNYIKRLHNDYLWYTRNGMCVLFEWDEWKKVDPEIITEIHAVDVRTTLENIPDRYVYKYVAINSLFGK